MSFGAPGWFWALLALPALATLFVRAERRSVQRLRYFASTRLLPQLTGTVNRFRRGLRFGLQLSALALAVISLAQPRWGYTFEDVKRKGIDLLIAVDTSRSMLSNDVRPNRLERVKLVTQDLVNQLQGDRVGLIAFAGRAFVQAPLTIDYDAVIETIHDLDTKTIPEGGTNISEAITLADRTYGKSAVGNRALVIFTDGEELSGDAVKTAKNAADAGVRIFTIGVGTPEGSLIPISGDDGATAFVKDAKGQVVKSKLDEKRLREIGEATGGFYLHLQNGPRTMQQLFKEGLAKMQAGEIDVRLARRPIDRYEWPLSAAFVLLAISMLIGDRKRVRARSYASSKLRTAAAALVVISFQSAFATAPGLKLYREGKYQDAYQRFQEDLRNHPESQARDKMQFDAGAAAYKMRDYNKAAEAFSQALLTTDRILQRNSHYNMGRTLEERADMSKTDEDALKDLTNAQTHYEDVLKLDPANKAAKDQLEEVKKKIERLKKNPKQKPPPPSQQPKDKQKDQKQQPEPQKQDQQNGQSKDQQQSSQQDQQQQNQEQQDQKQQSQSQSQNQSGDSQKQNPDNRQDQSQAKNEQQKKEQPKPGETPSPTPGASQQQDAQPSPSPGEGKNEKDRQDSAGDREQPSPSPGDDPAPSPSPSEGEGSGEGSQSSPTPAETPKKKLAGEIKGAADDNPQKPSENDAQIADTELEKEGQMSERQAEALLQSMKGEEARVQLDERKAARRVYNDW